MHLSCVLDDDDIKILSRNILRDLDNRKNLLKEICLPIMCLISLFLSKHCFRSHLKKCR